MNINEYIKAHRKPGDFRVPRITCNDGFIMSVQAGEFLYAKPRKDNADRYTQVEVGFPSAKPLFFADYAEDDSDYTDTVYPYVPVELVDEEIKAHGGIKV